MNIDCVRECVFVCFLQTDETKKKKRKARGVIV